MDVERFAEGGPIDRARRTRLAVASVAAAAFIGLLLYAAVVSARAQRPEEESTAPVPVTFADLEELEAPEPEPPAPEPEDLPPEPPPEPPPPTAAPTLPPPTPDPGAQMDANTDEMPDGPPDEADPSDAPAPEVGALGDGSSGPPRVGPRGPRTSRPGPSATPSAPPPPPPSKPGLTRITEDVVPPKMLSCPSPSPPPDLVGEGGVVIVKYIVEANGAVGRVKAVRGPAALRPYAEAAVKGCRFSPARDKASGTALRVPRVARIPFRAKTQL
ncbi:MAG: hypothetical protein AAF715_01465 [Myxococcota bacterium]